MKTKRILSAVMAVMLAVSMTACGEKGNDKNESDKKKTSADVTTTITTPTETTTTAPPEENEPVSITTTLPTEETEKITTTTTKPDDKPTNSSKKLDVVGINGYSDLKSGSGITAAATVLGYYGINIEPIKLKEYADVHGTSAKVDGFTPSPWDVIVDEPIGPNALYYAKPIINMINNYLAEKGITNVKPKDISGATLSELIAYIDEGKPVIVWGTSDGKPAEDSISWILPNGEKFVAKDSMNVYTLIGYTDTEFILLTHSKYELNVSKEIFVTMYESIYSQAILIE